MDYESDVVANRALRPASKPHSSREVHAVPFVAVLDDQVALGDLIGLAALPEYCKPVDLDIYAEDLDDATALVWSAGILNADGDDLVTGSNLITGSTVGRTAGMQGVNVPDCIHKVATWLAQSDSPKIHEEKIVAMKITTAAGTPVAGNVYGVLKYIASEFNA